MNAKVVSYWIATVLIALETFAGGIVDLLHGRTNVFSGVPVVDIVTRLGYPVYLLTILGIWKLCGSITLIVPGLLRLKEWAYAGFFFAMSGAAVSHIVSGDGVKDIFPSVLLLTLTVVSWYFRPANRKLTPATA